MKSISVEELKEVQLNILKEVDRFCKESNITYWIDYGTLLGAVRHKGFIPWDDDIDIGMFRGDWNVFCNSFNNYNEQYKLICADFDNSYPWGFGKIIDTNTILYEPDEKGYKGAVNIDIFVYDKACDNKNTLLSHYKKCQLLRMLHTQRQNTFIPHGGITRKSIIYLFRLFLKFFPKGFFYKLLIKESQRFNQSNNDEVIVYVSGRKKPQVYKEQWFKKTIDILFEGYLFKAPIGWDDLLKAEYGEYLRLPPPEKRVTHHQFVGFFKDEGE